MGELLLVRHGETVGQSSIRLFGATDLALSVEGEQQMAATGRSLTGLRFDRVLTSPMIRARRSTEVLLEQLGHPPIPIEVVDAFTEIDFGRWEGWTWDEVRERDPIEFARWSSEGMSFRFPAGDSRSEFRARVATEVPRIVGAFEHERCERVLVVVHKGVIKAIANLLAAAIPEQVEVELGGVHRLVYAEGRFRSGPRP